VHQPPRQSLKKSLAFRSENFASIGIDQLSTLDQRSTAMKSDSDREIAIFTEALKVSLQERAAFLERVCRGEEDLRRKVEALLKAHDRMGDFLQEPPTGGFIE
jgi:hypothetical protein